MEFRKWKVEGIEFQTGQALVVRVHTLVPSILDPSLVRYLCAAARAACICGARRILRRLVLKLRFSQGFRGLFESCPLR